MNFMSVIKLDTVSLLEEMDQFFRSVSIDILIVKKAIASGDVTTVKMICKFYSIRAKATDAHEMRGIKKSTLERFCDILDLYIQEHEKKGD